MYSETLVKVIFCVLSLICKPKWLLSNVIVIESLASYSIGNKWEISESYRIVASHVEVYLYSATESATLNFIRKRLEVK